MKVIVNKQPSIVYREIHQYNVWTELDVMYALNLGSVFQFRNEFSTYPSYMSKTWVKAVYAL